MNSAKRARNVSSTATSQKPDKQNSDPLWSVQNQQLESEAQANSRLREQITKQSYADSSVQAEIKDKICLLKENAVKLAQKLEGEKRKNIQLSAIIKHMSFIREEEKKIQTQHRDDLNFQNIDNLLRKIKKLQYDLQQIFSKLNQLTSKNKQKKNEVDTFRTQRVIDSGIFLKIQKQIIQYETQYKKLLIEKTKFEKEYNKNLQNYKKMKADIEKQQYVSLSKRESNEKPQNQQNFFMNVPQIEHAVKFTQINQEQGKKKSFSCSKKILTVVDAKRQQHHQQVEYAVKRLFMDTGLNTYESFVDLYNNIQQINDGLFKEVNRDTDKIAQLTKQIIDLKSKKAAKTIKYYEKQPLMTKSELKMKEAKILESQVEKVQASVNKQTLHLNEFMKANELRIISATAGIEFPEEFGVQDLQEFLANLQNNLNSIISNYTQFKKDLCDEEAKLRRESQQKQESVEQLISKIKKMQESQKIMVRQDFQKEYEKVLKSQGIGKRKNGKKKTTLIKKY